ncbi:MAG: radical SAM protein [Deltaproteobacteria bacterium]|nr:radical SAM protein [Deltaproteobacteria bacterium]
MSIELTRRCIARCVMCNIWKAPRDLPERTAEEWLELLASPYLAGLRELDLTGGEPFLRADLVELLLGIGRLREQHLRRLRSVAITTNGFLTRKILDDVRAVIGPLAERGVGVVFACGMDAIGELHDRIRGYSDGWTQLNATIEGLMSVRETHPSLVLGLKTTITPHNVDELDRVAHYAEQRSLFTIISPCILTAARYDNIEHREALEFSTADREKIRRFYQGPHFRWSYYRDELIRFLEEGRMRKPCSAAFNYYFIRSTGELFACPIIPSPLGNVTETPIEGLARSSRARRFRRGVGHFSECRTCTEPGLERYALPFEGFHYLRLRFEKGREQFVALHQHLGLDKYFP